MNSLMGHLRQPLRATPSGVLLAGYQKNAAPSGQSLHLPSASKTPLQGAHPLKSGTFT